MTGPTLDELFDSFAATAVRVEALPVYAVGGAEAERIAAWREHRPRPERSVRTNAYLRRIAVTTAQNKRWTRLRVLDTPLTWYEEYQLAGYIESQAAGEEILIVDRGAGEPPADFWLFDAGLPDVRAAAMSYAGDGSFLGVTMFDGVRAEPFEATARALTTAAVPLNTWLAARERIGA